MATVEIDGKNCPAENGEMIIEVADRSGIHIPRFCYHKKLSVAANCRMCLVEVENARKPVPACATPITDGMKVLTQSPEARHSQAAVMEFLLINHPLDCPICDQGGECELQDVSMGYGKDVSRFTEGKRSVEDENIGPLIDTNMTRCIHCTRCVRFGEEIAGLRELGATGRGEDMRIGTYIKHSVNSEISGNVIDLCPVGALTNKPSRYAARAWELQQTPTIAMHDCIGTNLNVHSRRGQVMRTVPRENESINETWITDRDRYGALGVHSEDRLDRPMIKRNGEWETVDWQTALTETVERLRAVINEAGSEQLAAVISPNSTVEEAYLLQKLMRGLGCHNIDHRLREVDFADQAHMPLFPGMTSAYSLLSQQQAILLIGSNIRYEQPLAAVKVRQAELNGGQIMAINSVDFNFNFPLAVKQIVSPNEMVLTLARVAKALAQEAEKIEPAITILLQEIEVDEVAKTIAKTLQTSEQASLILGACAYQSTSAAILRTLATIIAQLSSAQVIYMTDGANSAGAWLAGAVPHRGAMGMNHGTPGLTALEAWQERLKAYLLVNIEPELDCANPVMTQQALHEAQCVVVCSPYATPTMREYADIILPITPFTEMAGTVVNVEGKWQNLRACVRPYEQARPAWKVLRVMANLFHMVDFDYESIDQIRAELDELYAEQLFKTPTIFYPETLTTTTDKAEIYRVGPWAMYRSDHIVRRSKPLQQVDVHDTFELRIHPDLAKRLQVADGDQLSVQQEGETISLPVILDAQVADHCVYLVSGFNHTIGLGSAFGPIACRNDANTQTQGTKA